MTTKAELDVLKKAMDRAAQHAKPRGLVACRPPGLWSHWRPRWPLRRVWWKLGWKRVVCCWCGHKWAVVEYRIHRGVVPRFDSVECVRCGERAAIYELPE